MEVMGRISIGIWHEKKYSIAMVKEIIVLSKEV